MLIDTMSFIAHIEALIVSGSIDRCDDEEWAYVKKSEGYVTLGKFEF